MEEQESTREAAASLDEKIHLLASMMSRDQDAGGLGTGEMAELRRWRYGGAVQPAAWRLLARFAKASGAMSLESENRWLAVLSGMAHMSPAPHRPGEKPGKILAEAGYSENRFHKLLNSQGDAFFDAVERTCRFLRAKGVSMDWSRFARFILTRDPDQAEEQRRQLARDYFAHQTSK
ncbi:MAG: type I-E CRISPR-associated protein Cse2/CasB [Magnetococcales bacterium]|nr:type I-E CRISPR-associated protein Cse2/CasB [Magnetococcales bacterium]